jgi:hypothetical protein
LRKDVVFVGEKVAVLLEHQHVADAKGEVVPLMKRKAALQKELQQAKLARIVTRNISARAERSYSRLLISSGWKASSGRELIALTDADERRIGSR